MYCILVCCQRMELTHLPHTLYPSSWLDLTEWQFRPWLCFESLINNVDSISSLLNSEFRVMFRRDRCHYLTSAYIYYFWWNRRSWFGNPQFPFNLSNRWDYWNLEMDNFDCEKYLLNSKLTVRPYSDGDLYLKPTCIIYSIWWNRRNTFDSQLTYRIN